MGLFTGDEGGLYMPTCGWGSVTGDLVVYVAEEGADAERVDLLTGYLRTELLTLADAGVEVSVLHGGELPAGARAIDAVALGGLLVQLGPAANAVRSVVAGIVRWLAASPNRGRTVRLELDGDVLMLSEATAAEEARLVDLFVARHIPSGD